MVLRRLPDWRYIQTNLGALHPEFCYHHWYHYCGPASLRFTAAPELLSPYITAGQAAICHPFQCRYRTCCRHTYPLRSVFTAVPVGFYSLLSWPGGSFTWDSN